MTDHKNKQHNRRVFILSICALFLLTSCATSDDQAYGGSVPDPFENVNRVVLDVNEAVDKAVLEPTAKTYRKYTPRAFRLGLRNFLRNLKSPIIIANQMLQGDLDGTVNSTGRMIINTLAGFGGLVDFAAMGGIAYEPEDFGQTLAKWGVGNGAYLIIPIFGPSTLRDGAGQLIDSYADPLRLYLFNTDRKEWHYGRMGASVLDKREELIDVIDDLRRNSFDYYAAIRSAYVQHRNALINDQGTQIGEHSAGPEIPDY